MTDDEKISFLNKVFRELYDELADVSISASIKSNGESVSIFTKDGIDYGLAAIHGGMVRAINDGLRIDEWS